jgi:hypothetical protein
MSTARKIEVVLTEAQYDALASAVGHLATALEQDGQGVQDRGLQRALDNGWSRVRTAWHAHARGAARHE